MASLSGGEAGAEEDDERERFDAEVQQLPDDVLRDKKLRLEKMLKTEVRVRLRDGGKKLRASMDAICRELARRKSLGQAPQPHGGGPEALTQDEKRCERVVRSRGAESSGITRDFNSSKVTKADFMIAFGMDVQAGVGRSSLEMTSRSHGKPNASVKNEGRFRQEKKSHKSSSPPMISSQKELSIDDSANMEKTSSDDPPKYNDHNKTFTPARTPSRKRKADASVGFSMRLRSRMEEVVLVDGDTHVEPAEETSNRWSAEKLYYPSREHPNSVEISSDDMKCLEPESLLSSPIMNFYIMYLQGATSSTVRPRTEYHIFNTYFFSKLEALTSKDDKTTYFLKLRRWWKGVDIFQKAYILLPVHAELNWLLLWFQLVSAHWSLVIICMPAKDDQTGPIILHLDSLKFHSSRLIFNVVSRFLKEEWSYLNKNVSLTESPLQEKVWKNLPRKIENKKVEVPQQENDYDCGVFVLYNMQRFIQEAPKRLHKKDLSMFGKRWFKPEEPSKLRLEIRCLILSFGEAEPKNDAIELSCGEAEPKNDATEQSFVEAESKNGTTAPSCSETDSKKYLTEPASEVLTEAVEVASTEVQASVQEICSCD